MSLYFVTTEITNIDNLVPQTGLDITDLWFGETNVYTIWQTYEGALPTTLNANGDDLRQYQVWGNTGGVGDKTVNLFDISAETLIDVTGAGAMRTGVYLGFLAVGQYTLTFDAPHNYSLFITRKNGSTYTYQDVRKSQLPFTFSVNSGNEIIIRLTNTQTFEQQQFTNICVVSGTTPPETFVPFGYEIDISTSDGTNTTTTPIYIGDDPLDKDEYVDYQAGKIYRMIYGTLTPTDPPVTLSALPTCEGETVVDYVGGSAAPEKILLKYRKEGF